MKKIKFLLIKNMHGPVKILTIFILSLTIATGCKKLVTVDAPYTSIANTNVYNSDATAIAVLTGIYTQMASSGPPGGYASIGLPSMSFYAGLSADEFTLWNGVSNTQDVAYYQNNLSPANSGAGFEMWDAIYNSIFTCNAAIAGLSQSTGLSPAVKKQLLGEADFMRGYFYFYLVNLYGDLPLVLTTDVKTQSLLSRTPKLQIYQQIIADVTNAQALLSSDFVDGSVINTTGERVRPTKWAAAALLARVYLYYGNLTGDATNYAKSEAQASTVINNSSLFALDSLNGVFLKNSMEAIWQLQPVSAYPTNTEDGFTFIIPSSGLNDPLNPVYLSDYLLKSFEPGDLRKTQWTDTIILGGTLYTFPYKYKINDASAPVSEYTMMLRLGEQYLVRAEASANLGESSAISDLNIIRNRAGLSNYTGTADKTSLLSAILHERQVELFTELGHRWLDLKRTNTINAVMNVVTPKKGGTWSSTKQLYPIPNTDVIADPNLKQNPGY